MALVDQVGQRTPKGTEQGDLASGLDLVPYYGVYFATMTTVGPFATLTPPPTPDRPLTVGQVALQAGVGVETVRFYEREGLLPPPPRTPAGYRQYTKATVEQLQFIQRAKELGFSLREAQELLALRSADSSSAANAHARAAAKVEEISAKIRDLEAMRVQLSSLLVACAGRETNAACPILIALDGPSRAG